ncbi:MAG TPA: AAA family ATPase [Solirubrobacteraceae bacterium]|nr:AAA family ATPase [Solirubrobacteraceae bacterium]
MAASEMIQELIRAHVEGNPKRFRTVALQLAAREARNGHRVMAGRIRDLVDADLAPAPVDSASGGPTPLARPSEDLRSVLASAYPKERLGDIVLVGDLVQVLPRILVEHRSRELLDRFGLAPRRRILLHGPPGCGKTLAAAVLAGELGLPLMRVRIETLFSRYLGQTAALLTAVFEEMSRVRGVFLFDEFDALGRQRFASNDVGEASRVVSTFLQLVDADDSEAIIVAATNGAEEIDRAVFRRFDDVALVPLPSVSAISKLLVLRTKGHRIPAAQLKAIAESLDGLSFSEADRTVTEALKTMVLNGRRRLTSADLRAGVEGVRTRAVTPRA